jgi:hypothetical protein
MAARPTALTPEAVRKLLSALRAGLPRIEACRTAGIGRQTFYDRMKVDRAFRASVKKAQSKPERRWLARIEAAAREPKHWMAAAWLLEHLMPEKYALRITRVIEREREAMLAELRKTLDEEKFLEVARALVVAQQNARGSSRQRPSATH